MQGKRVPQVMRMQRILTVAIIDLIIHVFTFPTLYIVNGQTYT